MIVLFEYFFGYFGNWVFNVYGFDEGCVDLMMVDLLCWYGVEEVEYCIVVFDIYWYMGGIYWEWCVYMVFVILLLFYYIMIGVKFMYWCDLDVGCYLGFVFVWW